VQRVQAAEPKLAKTPLILSTRDPRRGLLVVAANLAARDAGIRPAMRVSEATALVDTEIREHDLNEDIDTLCILTEQAQQFSPIVGLEQLDKKLWAGRSVHQPECLLLDVTGLASLFGGEAALMGQVSHWLRTQHYFGCMAIAGSVGAAWAMANYGTRRLPQATKPPARQSGSETAPENNTDDNPDSEYQRSIPECRCYSLPSGDVEALTALPLTALRLAPETIVNLNRLGLRRIAELQQLPRAGMATRLGEALLTRWDQVLGLIDEPIVTIHALPDWNLEQTLEVPTENRETIAELVRRLSRELSRRLTQRGEGVLRLVCRLDLVKRSPLLMQLGLFRPTNDTQHLEMLLAGQLEQQLREVRTAPLWRLSLQATLTAPMVWRQPDLFSGGAVANRDEIARLVDTLSCRLGRKAVLSAKVRRESQPELASSFHPMTGRRHDGAEQATVRKLSSRLARQRAEPSREDPLRRPTQLLNPPIAIEVAGVWRCEESQRDEPQQRDKETPKVMATSATPANTMPQNTTTLKTEESHVAAAPAKIKHQNAWHVVIDACGPERLESGWWKGPSARRDYYRVMTSTGSWWWIYRDLNTAGWFLHGLFD
jgi:protein ImuB